MSSDGPNLESAKVAPAGFPRQELDALRRHICQILGFDLALIDIVRNQYGENVFTFCLEDLGEDHSPENLVDANGEPLSHPNSKLADEVRKRSTPYVGRAYSFDDDTSDEQAGFPYIIVAISDGQGPAETRIKGLIRAVSFDSTRKIENHDISDVRLIGQHLATRLPHLYLAAKSSGAEAPIVDGASEEHAGAPEPEGVERERETVIVAHRNRAIRRRLVRSLNSEFEVIETDDPQKVINDLPPEREKEIALLVLDSQFQDSASGQMYCKVLKESNAWKHTPIVLVVSETDSDSKVEGLNAGANDCVTDTCLDAELLARVRASLRLRKTERELATQLVLLEEYAQELEYVTEVERLASAKIADERMDLKVSKQQLQILRSQDEILRRVSDCIRKSFNIDENIDEMLADLAGWLDLDSCFVVLTEECDPQDIIRKEQSTHEGYRLMDKDYDLALLETFKSLNNNREIVLINDVKRDPRVEPFKEILSNYLLYSVFYVPVTYEEKLLGIFGGHKCESQTQWTADNAAFFGQIAVQIAIGVTNARLYKRVERQATTDGLTNLFNHRTGQEKLAEQLKLAERYSRNLAVVMMDVDHFKSINDTYGHPVGDTVLKSVAHIIRRDCRDVDIPVRYGGEEFLLVLPEVNREGAVVVAERLRKTLQREAIDHDDVNLSVTASIGVAAFPEDANNQHHLLELADKALYMSKRLGRNQVHTAADLAFHEFEKKQQAAAVTASLPVVTATASEEVAEPLNHNAVHEAPALGDDGDTPASVTPAVENNGESSEAAATAASDGDREGLVPEVVEMVKAMAGALYAKSDYNKVHHLETARFAEMVAKVLGLNQRQVEQIRVAGLLHDVGLLNVPEEIINKPGQVTAEELRVLMQHPIMGAQMFRPIHALKEICDILENHHECWDGTGYPRGLKGEEIPLAARIVAIVDAYHAMISDRPYRPAMSKDKAKRVLRHGAGEQFDPFLVDIFLAVLAENEESEQAERTS